MNVFKFNYSKEMYSGGIALVAAKNRSDAQLLLDDWWEFDSEIKGLTYEGQPCVIDSYVYIE